MHREGGIDLSQRIKSPLDLGKFGKDRVVHQYQSYGPHGLRTQTGSERKSGRNRWD